MTVDPSTKPTLFSKLFKAGEEGMSDEEVIADAQAYIIAGSDTTAVTLTYLVWSICRDDGIKQNLLEELSSLPDDFDAAHLRDLPYLNGVIDETLHVYGAAPASLPRMVPTGGANLSGFWIPGGTTVTAQAYTMHRNPSVFPRPETFDPSRWATPTKQMKESFMPFGAGSRSKSHSILAGVAIVAEPKLIDVSANQIRCLVCLGINLARMELRLAVALFFRRFPSARVSGREGMVDQDMDEVIYFLLGPKGRRCLIDVY